MTRALRIDAHATAHSVQAAIGRRRSQLVILQFSSQVPAELRARSLAYGRFAGTATR